MSRPNLISGCYSRAPYFDRPNSIARLLGYGIATRDQSLHAIDYMHRSTNRLIPDPIAWAFNPTGNLQLDQGSAVKN